MFGASYTFLFCALGRFSPCLRNRLFPIALEVASGILRWRWAALMAHDKLVLLVQQKLLIAKVAFLWANRASDLHCGRDPSSSCALRRLCSRFVSILAFANRWWCVKTKSNQANRLIRHSLARDRSNWGMSTCLVVSIERMVGCGCHKSAVTDSSLSFVETNY